MAAKIQVDYDELASVSSTFYRHVDSTDRLLQELRSFVRRLQGGSWVGDAADAFYTEMESQIFPAVGRLIDALDMSRNAVVKVSDIMQQAEYEASQILRREPGLMGGQELNFANIKFGEAGLKYGDAGLKYSGDIKFTGNPGLKYEGGDAGLKYGGDIKFTGDPGLKYEGGDAGLKYGGDIKFNGDPGFKYDGAAKFNGDPSLKYDDAGVKFSGGDFKFNQGTTPEAE